MLFVSAVFAAKSCLSLSVCLSIAEIRSPSDSSNILVFLISVTKFQQDHS